MPIAGKTGAAEVIIFSDVLEKYGDLIQNGALLLFEGEVTAGKGDRDDKMSVGRIVPLKRSRELMNPGVLIEVDGFNCDMGILEEVNTFVRNNPGRGRLLITVKFPSRRVVDFFSRAIKVNIDDKFLTGLRSILPESATVSLCRGDGRFR